MTWRFGEKSFPDSPPCSICHVTTAHRQLKSRTFHRELLPLSEHGIEIRYISPAERTAPSGAVTFIPLKSHRSRWRRVLSSPSLVPLLLRQNVDLYHFQDPELFPIAFLLKLVFRRRVVYDCYEDFPAAFANRQTMPGVVRNLAALTTAAVEAMAAECLDGLVTADALTLRRFARHGRSRKLVFYNFPNLDFFPASPEHKKLFDVVYRGGLSERAGTNVLIDAVSILASRGRTVSLLLLGYFDDGATERSFRDRIREAGIEKQVEIRGAIPHEDMAAALGSATIGVCPLQPVRKFLANIPVKVFEYWACSMPVVASNLPPIRPFFRHGEAGLLFEPQSAPQLARALAWLLDHPDVATRMGSKGRDLVVQRFNNRQEVQRLRRFCARIAASKAA